MGDQLAVDEAEERAECAVGQLLPFPALGQLAALVSAIGKLSSGGAAQSRQRYGDSSEGRVLRADRLGLLGGQGVLVVEDAQEEDPGQLGTYCSAPAQFERRMMSQMPLT